MESGDAIAIRAKLPPQVYNEVVTSETYSFDHESLVNT